VGNGAGIIHDLSHYADYLEDVDAVLPGESSMARKHPVPQ
jgi:hypothetical protein